MWKRYTFWDPTGTSREKYNCKISDGELNRAIFFFDSFNFESFTSFAFLNRLDHLNILIIFYHFDCLDHLLFWIVWKIYIV